MTSLSDAQRRLLERLSGPHYGSLGGHVIGDHRKETTTARALERRGLIECVGATTTGTVYVVTEAGRALSCGHIGSRDGAT